MLYTYTVVYISYFSKVGEKKLYDIKTLGSWVFLYSIPFYLVDTLLGYKVHLMFS